MRIVIGSKNPVKINAAATGFSLVFDKLEKAEGVNVPSGVSDQPMSSEETLLGARNRASNTKKMEPEADFWVGIEGGIDVNAQGEMEVFAWVVVLAKNGMEGKAKTAVFFLPPKVEELINEGMELGEADDLVFKRTDSKKKGGSVGILTKGIIDRERYYREAVVLALIPLMNEELYATWKN
ncbi:inosine/xanthosine triphosphatase [Flammeovirgaceae bacterium SG7u.111]|nr:inosine/xanthosine triphosphatase [Flammeovirgaceae bacterium SG7u.132]WPO37690.1 inosine/xanthosine triphosphatase [Flammeovirgaceae bacterium SG7u.111]